MRYFYLNGYLWRVIFVDPLDNELIDRTGKRTVATTDPYTGSVYISNTLYGEFLVKVLLHEIGHCAMVSFQLLDDIHRMVHPVYWIEVEEWVCNFIANYGMLIFQSAYQVLGVDAIAHVPQEVERLIS